MKVVVTGATGFVGGWLQRELTGSGHEVAATPAAKRLDIGDRDALVRWLPPAPDAVIHLAGMASAPEARTNPGEAFRVNVAGMLSLFEALRLLGLRPPVLVTGSSEVYGHPRPEDVPLNESAPLNPRHPYALSKAAQEAVAVEAGARWGFPVAVTRAFNHTGPGQRRSFVVPAMADRVLAVQRGETTSIRAGNVDVRRDIADVRDVARAYRLLLERLVAAGIGRPPVVVNVATGRAQSIRVLIEKLCDAAGIKAVIEVDPTLVRHDDPPEIRGDASLLTELTGWRPEIGLEETLADVLEVAREAVTAAENL